MKIGVDIRPLMDKKYSGVSSYTLNLVNNIISLDKKNHYKLFYNSFSDISNRIPDFKGQNVEIIKKRFPNKVLNYLFFKVFKRPQLDQLLGVDFFLMPHINFIALNSSSKLILVIHDLSFLHYPEFFNWRKNFWHRFIGIKKLIKRADLIVAISENTKNDLINLANVSENKIKVIYSGLDEKYYNFVYPEENKKKIIKTKYNLPEKFILFLGNIEPRKNILGIIQSYNFFRKKNPELKDYKLVLAGGLGWKNKRILQEYQKSEFKDDIMFLGYVDEKDKPFIYNLSSVFVFPSFYEGFGFPPLEAQATGTPVISSFSSSLPEILGNSAILVDPYNIKDLTKSIIDVLKNLELKEKLIVSGKENVKRFQWQKTAKKYLELLEELKQQ